MIRTLFQNLWEKEKNEPLLSAHEHNLSRSEQALLFLLFLFAPTQLGRHFWPSFTTVLGIRIDYLSPTLFVTDLIIGLLLGFFLWRMIQTNQVVSLLQSSWKVFLLMLFLLGGIYFSQSPFLGLYGVARVLECFLLFLYLKTVWAHPRVPLFFATALLLGVIGESSLAIAQYGLQHAVGGVLYWVGERTFTLSTPGIATASLNGELVLRPYGTFPHPNVLAAFLFLAMVYVANVSVKNQWHVRLVACSLVLGALALLLTLSRITILLGTLTLVGAMVAWGYPAHRKILRWMFGTLFLLGIVVAVTPLSSRFFHSSLFEESVTVRVSLLEAAVRMIAAHPLLGVGVQEFLVALPMYQTHITGSLFTAFQPVHNIYLLIAAETGLIGLGLFLWLLGTTYKRIIHDVLQVRGSKKNLLLNVRFILLTGVCFLGLFDHYFITIQQGRLLLVFLLSYAWVSPPGKAKIPKKNRGFRK